MSLFLRMINFVKVNPLSHLTYFIFLLLFFSLFQFVGFSQSRTAMANITTAGGITSTGYTTTIPELPVILPAELSRSAYNFLAVYTGFLTVVGIFNNGLVIFLFVKFPNLRQPVNIFLLNLSISDMTVSLFGSPLTFASNIAGYWLFGQIGCSIYAFIVMIGGKSSNYS